MVWARRHQQADGQRSLLLVPEMAYRADQGRVTLKLVWCETDTSVLCSFDFETAATWTVPWHNALASSYLPFDRD